MTTSEAWRWVAHHWAYGLLRLTVVYVDCGVTAVLTARRIGARRGTT